jgi:hypothetical protein
MSQRVGECLRFPSCDGRATSDLTLTVNPSSASIHFLSFGALPTFSGVALGLDVLLPVLLCHWLLTHPAVRLGDVATADRPPPAGTLGICNFSFFLSIALHALSFSRPRKSPLVYRT